MGNHAEQMKRIGMAGIGLQNLTIKALGVPQPAGLMMPQADIEKCLHARVLNF